MEEISMEKKKRRFNLIGDFELGNDPFGLDDLGIFSDEYDEEEED